MRGSDSWNELSVTWRETPAYSPMASIQIVIPHSYCTHWSTLSLVLTDNHSNEGVTLAQLVKASVGQADVQRFEPRA